MYSDRIVFAIFLSTGGERWIQFLYLPLPLSAGTCPVSFASSSLAQSSQPPECRNDFEPSWSSFVPVPNYDQIRVTTIYKGALMGSFLYNQPQSVARFPIRVTYIQLTNLHNDTRQGRSEWRNKNYLFMIHLHDMSGDSSSRRQWVSRASDDLFIGYTKLLIQSIAGGNGRIYLIRFASPLWSVNHFPFNCLIIIALETNSSADGFVA